MEDDIDELEFVDRHVRAGDADNANEFIRTEPGEPDELPDQPDIIGREIVFAALAIVRWWTAGAPIQNRLDLIYWNVLCRTAQRRPGRRVKPERLELAVRIAWCDHVEPVPTDATLLGHRLGGKKEAWLDLVRDARYEMARIMGGHLTLNPDASLRDADVKRRVERLSKKGTYTRRGRTENPPCCA